MVDSVHANDGKPSQNDDDESMIVVGQIKGAWGLLGDLKVEVLSANPERFSPGTVLYLEDQLVQVERSRKVKNGILLKIDLINDRTKAGALQGKYLSVPQQDVEPLPEGSYYHFHILDLAVWTSEAEYLGELKKSCSPEATMCTWSRTGKEKNCCFPR